jgi:hypothetical protein
LRFRKDINERRKEREGGERKEEVREKAFLKSKKEGNLTFENSIVGGRRWRQGGYTSLISSTKDSLNFF